MELENKDQVFGALHSHKSVGTKRASPIGQIAPGNESVGRLLAAQLWHSRIVHSSVKNCQEVPLTLNMRTRYYLNIEEDLSRELKNS